MTVQRSVSRRTRARFFRHAARVASSGGPASSMRVMRRAKVRMPARGLLISCAMDAESWPERGELLAPREDLLRALERRRAVLDLMLEVVREVLELLARPRERHVHLVEGVREDPELVRRADRERRRQVAVADSLRGLHELFHGAKDDPPRDAVDEGRQRDHGEKGCARHAQGLGVQARVDVPERDADVHDAEDAGFRRMCVAGRRRAGRLVVDRRHHAEDAVAVRHEEPAARGRRGRHERLAGRVAGRAGFRILVDGTADVARVRRKHDAAFLVEDADLLDALRGRPDSLHDPVGVVPLVLEHEIPRAARDRAREQRRAPDDLADEVSPLGADGEKREQRDRRERDRRGGRRQLEPEMPVERDAEQRFLQPQDPATRRPVNPPFELGGSRRRFSLLFGASGPRRAGSRRSTRGALRERPGRSRPPGSRCPGRAPPRRRT